MGRKRHLHWVCKCGKPTRTRSSGYCADCFNAYQRANRKRHSELTQEQKLKANARSYLNVYIRRGKIKKQPCCICGNENAQAHHEDYLKPLEVIWCCKKHHIEYHDTKNGIEPIDIDNEPLERVRLRKGERTIFCSKCGQPKKGIDRYCKKCRLEYNRKRSSPVTASGRIISVIFLCFGLCCKLVCGNFCGWQF